MAAVKTQTVSNDAKPGSDADGLPVTTGMPCPDPSAHHTKDNALQNQASAAALYTTNHPGQPNPLGPDNKLSSASAASSLKYARAQDLPSFPVVGIDTQASAGAAATLANANRKSPEYWKPEQSAAAGKAALLANDYKMAPLWHPEASAAGSKAALLAHKEGPQLNLWTPEASNWGNSAANIAFRKKTPEADHSQQADARRKALIAATGAVSYGKKKRASSVPAPVPAYPDSANSAKNALSAATLAHRPSVKSVKSPTTSEYDRLDSGALEAARIQHSKNISREMYTEHPPVALEVEEKNRQNALRASAISMAKQMYDMQQKSIDEAAAGRSSRATGQSAATMAQNRQSNSSEPDIRQQAIQYINIQEAAQKLAAERLAKIDADETAKFRSYYGYDKPARKRISLRRGRGRANSDPQEAEDSSDDEFRSRRIRNQMSELNKSVADVDAKKREQDRRNLLAAAQKKVQAQMSGMDQKIFDETGKMSPAMIEEWDAKARAKAAAESEARMVNHGKVHIGGGRYLDQSEIDAVAAARVQPTLDEINESTEKQRAKDEEVRLDQEQRKRETQIEKQRAAELKAEEKRIREQEKKQAKGRNAGEKAAFRQEKEAEKAKKAEERRLQKEEKRQGQETSKQSPTEATAPLELEQHPAPAEDVEDRDDDLYRGPTAAQQPQEAEAAKLGSGPTSPASPTKTGFRGFLSSKLKRRSKHSAAQAEKDKPGFIGGIALTGRSSHSNPPSSEPQSPRPMTDTASNNRDAVTVPGPSHEVHHSPSISSLSSEYSIDARGRDAERTTSGISTVSHESDFEEARDNFNEELAPPPSFGTEGGAGRKGSPSRDSKFHEVGI